MKRLILALLFTTFTLMLYPSAASARYTDGMNLYEYVKSSPGSAVDPDGRIIVALSGLGQPATDLKPIVKKIMWNLSPTLMWKYQTLPKSNVEYIIFLKGKGGGAAKGALKSAYKLFLERKRKDKCSLEQFIAIGHSDGATAIVRNLQGKTFTGGKTGEFTPAYLGVIDMVRTLYCPFLSLLGIGVNTSDHGTATINSPVGTWVDAFRQIEGSPEIPWLHFGKWKGRYIKGAQYNRLVQGAPSGEKRLTHFTIIKHKDVIDRIGSMAAKKYAERVRREKRAKPWNRAASKRKGKWFGKW